MTKTLGDAYPEEQARCRELLALYYRELSGPQCYTAFAEAVIEAVLKEADEAAIEGDIVRMIAAFRAMQGCA